MRKLLRKIMAKPQFLKGAEFEARLHGDLDTRFHSYKRLKVY